MRLTGRIHPPLRNDDNGSSSSWRVSRDEIDSFVPQLSGLPVRIEFKGPSVGRVDGAWVSPLDGWVWASVVISSAAESEVKEKLDCGDLNHLALAMDAHIDKVTGSRTSAFKVIDLNLVCESAFPDTPCVEVSVTTQLLPNQDGPASVQVGA